jgi:hypothetical protein
LCAALVDFIADEDVLAVEIDTDEETMQVIHISRTTEYATQPPRS